MSESFWIQIRCFSYYLDIAGNNYITFSNKNEILHAINCFLSHFLELFLLFIYYNKDTKYFFIDDSNTIVRKTNCNLFVFMISKSVFLYKETNKNHIHKILNYTRQSSYMANIDYRKMKKCPMYAWTFGNSKRSPKSVLHKSEATFWCRGDTKKMSLKDEGCNLKQMKTHPIPLWDIFKNHANTNKCLQEKKDAT